MQGNRNSIWLGAVWLAMVAGMPASSAAAPMFSEIYVIGDSLSDTGNTEIVAPGGDIPGTDFTYGDNGRFSNGPVWAEYLGHSLGLGTSLQPSRSGGTNYAHGGAAIDFKTGQEAGLLTQYQRYIEDLGGQGAEADALYAVWGGANDLRDKIGPDSDPVAVIANSIAGYRTILAGLIDSGAEHVLVPNVPNLGRTPEAALAGLQQQATQLSLLWNSFLGAMLGDLEQETGASIYAYDTFALVEGIFASPESFGFTNTSEPCAVLQGNMQVGCDNPDDYIFWDILHPTTAAHGVIGQGAYELLLAQGPVGVPVPAPVWLLLPGLGLLLLGRRQLARRSANAGPEGCKAAMPHG